jgi:hypothetical protein
MFQANPDSAPGYCLKDSSGKGSTLIHTVSDTVLLPLHPGFSSPQQILLRFLTCRPDSSQEIQQQCFLLSCNRPPETVSGLQGKLPARDSSAGPATKAPEGFWDSNAIAKAENTAIFDWNSLSVHYSPFFRFITIFRSFPSYFLKTFYSFRF